jgi:hypothetical protein
MEAKKNNVGHTPGPWHRDAAMNPVAVDMDIPQDSGLVTVSAPDAGGENGGDWLIAIVANGLLNDERGNSEQRANARLISAAPALLEACKDAAENCPVCNGDGTTLDPKHGQVECEWCPKLRAALALASPAEEVGG